MPLRRSRSFSDEFAILDADRSGTVTKDEVREAMRRAGVALESEEELIMIMQRIDVDNNGKMALIECVPATRGALARKRGSGRAGVGGFPTPIPRCCAAQILQVPVPCSSAASRYANPIPHRMTSQILHVPRLLLQCTSQLPGFVAWR